MITNTINPFAYLQGTEKILSLGVIIIITKIIKTIIVVVVVIVVVVAVVVVDSICTSVTFGCYCSHPISVRNMHLIVLLLLLEIILL